MQQPSQINVGGIGAAQQGSNTAQEAGAKAGAFGRADLAAARLPTSPRKLKKGETCGDDKKGKWTDAQCENSECKKKGNWWGCV